MRFNKILFIIAFFLVAVCSPCIADDYSSGYTGLEIDSGLEKTTHISVTQAVDLDTLESDTATNTSYLNQNVKDTVSPTFTGLQITPATAPAHSEGLLFYDSDQKTFVTYNDISTVSQNIGEETWVRAVNKTGGALSNGDIVYIDTAQGNRPTIAEAQADAHDTACGTIGIVTQTTIADNAEGMVTAFGIVRGYDTSGFSAGDELFLSAGTAGLIVNVAPSSPNFRVRVGWALNSTGSGDIFVNPKVFPHADKIYIDDAGSLITATDVEGALQEHRTAINASVARANHTGTQATSTIVLPTINGVLTAEEQCNLLCASSHYEGGAFTDNSDGTITVAAGKGFIRASNVAGAQLLSFEWAENASVSLTDESTNYIYTSYHATVPTINSATSKPTDSRTNVLLGKVYRHGTHAHLFKAGMISDEFLSKIISRFTQVEGEITHASGGVISETGTRNVASTAAVVWGGLTRGTTAEKDTSGADTFHYFYYTGSAWTYSDLSQIDNLQYNNPASGLATLGNNQYGVHWVYLDPDGHMMVVYGQDSYLLGAAQDAQPLASLPSQVTEFCWLAAKVIVQKSDTSFTEIQSAYDTAYVASTASVHNELGGLNLDDYQHLTADELSVAQSQTDLSAIDALVASVDAVAVYYGRVADDDDTLWIEKTAWTSWYQETLNTTTRGATRAFPAEYLIVAENDKVTIYDATDSSLPMWRVHDYTGYTVTDITMINGVMAVATGTDLIVEDYGDEGQTIYDTGSSPAIVNSVVNAVAVMLLRGAGINPATGMRYVTIDAFTDGGTSRIQLVDGAYVAYDLVDTASDTHTAGVINASADSIAVNTTDPAIDIYEDVSADTNTVNRTYGAATTPALLSAPSSVSKIVAYDNTIAHGNADGLTVVEENSSTPASGAVAYITTDYNSGMMRGDIQLAVLADIEAGTVGEVYLAESSDFTSGWSQTEDGWTLTVSNASCDGVDPSEFLFPSPDVTAIGDWVTIIFTISAYTSGSLYISLSSGDASSSAYTAAGTYLFSGKVTVVDRIYFKSVNFVGTIEAVSVIETIPDRCVQANHLTVTGTLTKTAVATGAELMGWSGWSTTDYATLPYTSDLDFGTGDFKFPVWIKEAANSAMEVIFERDSATTAQRLTAQVNADGTVSFICDDNTTVRTATSTGVIDDGTWKKVEFEYSSGTLNIYINGILDGTATGAALLTLSNAAAVFNVGLDAQGANPLTNGSLALLRTTGTIGTTANRTSDYLKELLMFTPGAKCTLSGASDSVLALDYDSTTENLTVLTDVVDVFNGLANISQDTLSGTGQCVSVGNATTLIGTSTTVTFSKPAINLREELAKAPERIKQFGYLPEQFRFTGDTSETDFDLPAGWKVWAVYDTAGALMLEGATDDYIIEDDGDHKTVVFSSAPAALDFVIFGIPEQVSRLEWPDEYLMAA